MRGTRLVTARAATTCAVLLLLGGCGSAPPSPSDYYYRLLLPDAMARRSAPVVDGTVLVTRFRSEGVLADRAIAHARTAQPQELAQYSYHFWSAPPPEMLQLHVADYLRSSGVAHEVLLPEVGVDGSHELIGRIRRLEHLTGDAESVSVSLELGLLDLRDRSLLLLKTYDARGPVPAGGFSEVAAALNAAINEALQGFVSDVAALP
jgi:ABC-type uncharacterized transport system auxiliary subunit